ncbi:MAG TPA: alpha/beta hydrolase, partial [Gemmatimonadales bacterium]
MRRRRSKGILQWTLVGLLLIGPGYSNVKALIDARRFPPPGKLIDVGSHRLHLDCQGNGTPTVMLEAGAGAWSLAMRRLQDALRDSVKVCSYDRAGLGWSDPSSAGFDVASSVAELRMLIDSAGITKPVVLVGHSLGANIAQVYAASHPGDLAGIVLLDPGTPDDLLEDFTGTDSAALAITSCGWKCTLASATAWFGVVRFITRNAGRKTLLGEDGSAYRAALAR